MNYKETLEYLYRQMPEYQRIGHLAYKEGLENSLALDLYFHHPHKHYKTIHVGGTNGKGSVSHLLAAILQEAGYKTGLYTSPHLLDFRERIRVNGEKVEEQYVIDFVEKHRQAFEPIMPSFFELTMEMAFLYFAERQIDVAVIEVGLGGRLDSTNIISPDISIITNIGLEHTQYLGNTLPAIATEKAGIIKSDTPIVIGETGNEEVRAVFKEKANSVNAPITFAEEEMVDLKASRNNSGWTFNNSEYHNLKYELKGFAQEKNAKTVITAIEQLRKTGYVIPKESIYKGFEKVIEMTHLMGRWQLLQERPKIICDTGHNAHGIKYNVQQLKSEQYNQLHIVIGMVNDKDINSVLSLMPQEATYYFTKASVERSLNEKILAEKGKALGLKGNSYETVAEAVRVAKENAKEDDFIFIGGSNFIVADALPLFE